MIFFCSKYSVCFISVSLKPNRDLIYLSWKVEESFTQPYHFTLTSILVFLSIAGSLNVLFFISVLGSQRSTVMKRKDVEDSTSNLYQANGGFFLSPNWKVEKYQKVIIPLSSHLYPGIPQGYTGHSYFPFPHERARLIELAQSSLCCFPRLCQYPFFRDHAPLPPVWDVETNMS